MYASGNAISLRDRRKMRARKLLEREMYKEELVSQVQRRLVQAGKPLDRSAVQLIDAEVKQLLKSGRVQESDLDMVQTKVLHSRRTSRMGGGSRGMTMTATEYRELPVGRPKSSGGPVLRPISSSKQIPGSRSSERSRPQTGRSARGESPLKQAFAEENVDWTLLAEIQAAKFAAEQKRQRDQDREKKRAMKEILDRQVQEHRLLKQRQAEEELRYAATLQREQAAWMEEERMEKEARLAKEQQEREQILTQLDSYRTIQNEMANQKRQQELLEVELLQRDLKRQTEAERRRKQEARAKQNMQLVANEEQRKERRLREQREHELELEQQRKMVEAAEQRERDREAELKRIYRSRDRKIQNYKMHMNTYWEKAKEDERKALMAQEELARKQQEREENDKRRQLEDKLRIKEELRKQIEEKEKLKKIVAEAQKIEAETHKREAELAAMEEREKIRQLQHKNRTHRQLLEAQIEDERLRKTSRACDMSDVERRLNVKLVQNLVKDL